MIGQTRYYWTDTQASIDYQTQYVTGNATSGFIKFWPSTGISQSIYDADRWQRTFSDRARRIRRQQCHRPPPVPLELACVAAAPVLGRHAQGRPRATPWLAHTQSGPRERKPRRRRIRGWERAAAE